MYKWPLAKDSFTFWDKLKITKWILGNNQWTQGKLVKEYEQKWSEYTKCPYVIMTASGSASNELIALRAKYQLQKFGQWPKKNKVIFPVNTWVSSVSVWLNFGFEPVFVDLDINNLCADIKLIEKELKKRDDIGYVFYTTLLGFSGDLLKLKEICGKYKTGLGLDNCESGFSKIDDLHYCNLVTSSTSMYFSHLTTSGSESGLIFCQDKDEYAFYLMARSHGMTRSLNNYKDILGEDYIKSYTNPKVDKNFDFNILGSNYRSSDYLAFPALLDFRKREKYCLHRQKIYQFFNLELDSNKFHVIEPNILLTDTIPFVLPIILKENNQELIDKIKEYLNDNSIEFRQIVGGHLLFQFAFKQYKDNKSHKVSKHIHSNGIYIGLNQNLTKKLVQKWAIDLSRLD